jgi:hypothetical protein
VWGMGERGLGIGFSVLGYCYDSRVFSSPLCPRLEPRGTGFLAGLQESHKGTQAFVYHVP